MIINCDYCGSEFNKIPSNIKRHKNHFCKKQCKDLYGRKVTLDELKSQGVYIDVNKDNLSVIVKCDNCSDVNEIYPSKYKNILKNNANYFCSKNCRHEYDSINFKGEKNPNYQGGEVELICKQCGDIYEVRKYRKDTSTYCSRECKDQYLRDNPQITIDILLNQKREMTKPERFVRDYLASLNVEYVSQYVVDDKFVADFYIPSINLIIEVQGDYFHANPQFYGEGEGLRPLTDRQKKRIKSDSSKLGYYKHKQYKTLYLWEYDIVNNNFKSVIDKYILESVTTKLLSSNA